jgi:ABC-2 type transport system permease protein
MKKFLTSFNALLTASMKMYFRNRGAVVFTLIVPLALLAVFGFLSKGGNTTINIELTNYSQTQIASGFVNTLSNVSAFKVKQTTESQAQSDLGKGNIDLQVIVPKDFGQMDSSGKISQSAIVTHYNQAKPQNGQVANLIISQIIDGINAGASHTPQILSVNASGVQTNNLGFFDFILPGILGMIIMQSGIFAVAFAFVSFKASGSLRRLQATPVHPRNFVFAQAITRLIMTLITVAILIGFGIKFFNFHMLGSYWDFSVVVILGCLIFLGIGFAIAGYAKDENQVAPLANLVQLPMLLLSGIFFPRDAFPHWLYILTNYFPLTYLSDAMRHIANEGLRLTQIGPDLLGMIIWCVLIFVLAINVFSWE